MRRVWPLLGVALLATLVALGCAAPAIGSRDAQAFDPMVAAAGVWVAGGLPETPVGPEAAESAATETPLARPSATTTSTPSAVPPTATPTLTATVTATAAPTSTPLPTNTPMPTATAVPTALPPTPVPTAEPTATAVPTAAPTAVPPTAPPPPPQPTAVPPAAAAALGGDPVEQAAFAELNRRRGELGLAPLRPMVTLFTSAHLHSQDMAAARFFGHTGTDGSDAGARMRAAGYNWANWGEAVARSRPGDIAGVIQSLLDSPPHREILFSGAFTDGGVGVSYSPEGVPYWTFDVANPRG